MPETPSVAEAERHPSGLYSPGQRRIFLLVLFLVSMSNYVDKNVISVVLEPIKREFHASDTQLGLLSGLSFALFYATLGIPVARWADRGDRKLIMGLGLAVWSAMTVLCGAASSFWQLALARIGVGAGEAGGIPPGQSLLVDYYPVQRRAWALAVFSSSTVAAYGLGTIGGGWIAQAFGWRMAFWAAGLPGLLLLLAVVFILREPRRMPGFAVASADRETLLAAWTALSRKRAYVNILIGHIFYFVVSYGALIFAASFMVRCHGLSLAQAGGFIGVISAGAAIVGNLAGGLLADRLGRRSAAWYCWLPAGSMLLAWPLGEATFLMPTLIGTAAFLFLTTVLLSSSAAQIFTAMHTVCGSKRRSTALAILLFTGNLFGLGLGPILTGRISDALAGHVGSADGLRFAIMTMLSACAPLAFFLFRAARQMPFDVET